MDPGLDDGSSQVAPDRKDDLNPVEWERVRAAIAGRYDAWTPADSAKFPTPGP